MTAHRGGTAMRQVMGKAPMGIISFDPDSNFIKHEVSSHEVQGGTERKWQILI